MSCRSLITVCCRVGIPGKRLVSSSTARTIQQTAVVQCRRRSRALRFYDEIPNSYDCNRNRSNSHVVDRRRVWQIPQPSVRQLNAPDVNRRRRNIRSTSLAVFKLDKESLIFVSHCFRARFTAFGESANYMLKIKATTQNEALRHAIAAASECSWFSVTVPRQFKPILQDNLILPTGVISCTMRTNCTITVLRNRCTLA